MIKKSSKHIKPPPRLLILDSEGVPISYESPAEKQLRQKIESEKLEERIEGKFVSTYNEETYLIPIHPFNDLSSSEVLQGFVNKTYISSLTLKNQLRYNVGFIDSKGYKNILFYGINDVIGSCCTSNKLKELKIRLLYNQVNLDVRDKEVLPISFFTLMLHKPKSRWTSFCSDTINAINVFANRYWIYDHEKNRIMNEENQPVEILLLRISASFPFLLCGSIRFIVQNSKDEKIMEATSSTSCCSNKLILKVKDLKNGGCFGQITIYNEVLMEPEFNKLQIEFDKGWGFVEKIALYSISILMDNYMTSS